MRPLALFLPMLALAPFLQGFVLLSPDAAILPVSPEAPELNFVWDGNAPPVSGKDEFQGGRYAALEDKEFIAAVLTESMNLWNKIPSAYVTLTVSEAAAPGDAVMDPEDRKFSIVVEKSANASSAAFAVPNAMDDDPKTIADCDINLADRKVEAKEIAFTIAHELGHCLGLGHSHTNYRAMMGYSRMAKDFALGADDVAGIVYLYPDPTRVDDEPHEIVCGVAAGVSTSSALLLLLAGLVPYFAARRRQNGEG